MNGQELLKSYDRNGTLGELTGCQPRAQESFFRRARSRAQEQLQRARRRAAAEKQVVEIDASRLSGTNGGDHWLVQPDGRCRRRLQPFPTAEQLLLADRQRPPACRPCPDLDRARPLLLRCAYDGLWSPSGTNWQPVRTVELPPALMSRLAGRPVAGCGLAVLAPPRYQSILSDIAALAGLDPAARAEWIDPGIWLEVACLAARARGWRLEPREVDGPDGVAAALARQLPAGAEIRPALEAGGLRLLSLLEAWQGDDLARDDELPGGLVPGDFDRLVEARSTQRVADPAGQLPPAVLEQMWSESLRACGGAGVQVAMPVFTWHDEFPAQVGRAMHAGIDDLLKRLDAESLRRQLARLGGADIPDDAAALPAVAVPGHLRRRLEQQGLYRPQAGLLVDRRGRPLDCSRLLKLVRLVTRSFGKYFLRFRNTHPLLGVITLGPEAQDEHGFRLVGRLVARMGLLARARGYTSIIKSGPLEIAGREIARLLDEGGLLAPGWKPVLTFQVGLPLGPDDPVCAGESDEHDGLTERLLDRRSTRVALAERYFIS